MEFFSCPITTPKSQIAGWKDLTLAEIRSHRIRPIVDYLNNEMRELYYPAPELTINEDMILSRGQLVSRQYIKGKRHKYGIRIYSLNNSNAMCAPGKMTHAEINGTL